MEKQIIKDSGLDTSTGPAAYTGTRTVKHQNEYSFDVPADWDDVRDFKKNVVASADYGRWRDGRVPGVLVVSSSASPEAALKTYVTTTGTDFFPTCTAGPVRPYDDGNNVGVAQTFADCTAAQDGTASVVALAPKGSATAYVFDSTIIDARDISAVADVIRTFDLITP